MTLLHGRIPGFIRILEQEYEKPVLLPLGASQKKWLAWRNTGQRTSTESDRPEGLAWRNTGQPTGSDRPEGLAWRNTGQHTCTGSDRPEGLAWRNTGQRTCTGSDRPEGLAWPNTGQHTGSDRPEGERGIEYETVTIKVTSHKRSTWIG